MSRNTYDPAIQSTFRKPFTWSDEMPRTRRGKGNARRAPFRQDADLCRIDRVARQAGIHRGKLNEGRALRTLIEYVDKYPNRPPWLGTIRPATAAEDHLGIDIVVETDTWPLYIQVKSSEGYANRFKENRRRQWHSGRRTLIIGVVIVNEAMIDHLIGRALMKEVSALRDIIAKLGQNYMPVGDLPSPACEESAS